MRPNRLDLVFVRLLAASLSALALLLVPRPAAAGHHGEHAPPPPAIVWGTCGPDFPSAECAVVDVPLDYDHPRGRSTQLALARIPAADPDHRIGSVFVNPGGPGGPGVDFVLTGFGDYLAGLLQGRFDVVGFDPRGIAAALPKRGEP